MYIPGKLRIWPDKSTLRHVEELKGIAHIFSFLHCQVFLEELWDLPTKTTITFQSMDCGAFPLWSGFFGGLHCSCKCKNRHFKWKVLDFDLWLWFQLFCLLPLTPCLYSIQLNLLAPNSSFLICLFLCFYIQSLPFCLFLLLLFWRQHVLCINGEVGVDGKTCYI